MVNHPYEKFNLLVKEINGKDKITRKRREIEMFGYIPKRNYTETLVLEQINLCFRKRITQLIKGGRIHAF